MKGKSLLSGLILCAAVIGVVCGLLAWMHRRTERAPISRQIDPEQPMIALTFDDGPNARYTPQVLDVLYDQQAPATFFLVGEKLEANVPLLEEMAACGHELGNHTWSHTDLTTLDIAAIQQEVCRTEDCLASLLPDVRMTYVRPPYGHCDDRILLAAGRPMILWTIDSGDWVTEPDADRIYRAVLNGAQDGGVVVFHDNNPETVKALQDIIPALRQRGFQLVTVSQLCAYRDTQALARA